MASRFGKLVYRVVKPRRLVVPFSAFVAGYGTYHVKQREESVGQLIPLCLSHIYTRTASRLRFLRSTEEGSLPPELVELDFCMQILESAMEKGIPSDALRRHLLKTAAAVEVEGDHSTIQRLTLLTLLVEDMEKWRGDALLDACKTLRGLPASAETYSISRTLTAQSKKLEERSRQAVTWTTRVYGHDAPVPVETQFPEKEEIDNLLAEIWRKQRSISELGAQLQIFQRWEVLLPLLTIGTATAVYVLGQDVLGIAPYRASDIRPYLTERSIALRNNVREGIERLPPFPPMPALPHLPLDSMPNLPAMDAIQTSIKERIAMWHIASNDYILVTRELGGQIKTSFVTLASHAVEKADQAIERLRERVGGGPGDHEVIIVE